MRSYSWRRHNHPFTLSFLEEVLRWVGMNEVHKAVALFLETMAKQPGSPRTQRSEPLRFVRIHKFAGFVAETRT